MTSRAARVPAAVRRVAEQVVADHPGVEAVLLFGSRARGDHRPDSDIDLALVGPYCPNSAERRLLDADPRIEALYVTTADNLRAKANLATAIEAALVRQAKPIAGTWRRPRHRKEKLDVSTPDLARNLSAASTELHTGMTLTANSLDEDQLDDPDATTSAFNAAERIGKALLWSFGEVPKQVHNLATLADQLQGTSTGPDQAERAQLAKRLRAMNGLGPVGHTTTYEATGVFEITEDTADRLCDVAILQSEALRRLARYPEHPQPEPQDEERALFALSRCARQNLKQSAQVLSNPVPEPLRHAALTWFHAAAQASRTFQDALAEHQHPDSPEAARAAKTAARNEVETIGKDWLHEHPGARPPRAAPPRPEASDPTGTPQERIALAIVKARPHTRTCLHADPTSRRAMSIPSWEDLGEEARSFLETGDQSTGHIDGLAKQILGSAPATRTDWARAAHRLEHRARVVDASELASELNARATTAREATEALTERDVCGAIDDLTRPATIATTTAQRANALASMGPGFKAENDAHLEHAIGLIPRLDWRLTRIERRLGLGPPD